MVTRTVFPVQSGLCGRLQFSGKKGEARLGRTILVIVAALSTLGDRPSLHEPHSLDSSQLYVTGVMRFLNFGIILSEYFWSFVLFQICRGECGVRLPSCERQKTSDD